MENTKSKGFDNLMLNRRSKNINKVSIVVEDFESTNNCPDLPEIVLSPVKGKLKRSHLKTKKEIPAYFSPRI